MGDYADRGLIPPDTREVIEKAATLLTKGHEETYRLMLLGAMLELAGHPLRGGVTARTNWVKSMRCLGETCMAIYRRTEGSGA